MRDIAARKPSVQETFSQKSRLSGTATLFNRDKKGSDVLSPENEAALREIKAIDKVVNEKILADFMAKDL